MTHVDEPIRVEKFVSHNQPLKQVEDWIKDGIVEEMDLAEFELIIKT